MGPSLPDALGSFLLSPLDGPPGTDAESAVSGAFDALALRGDAALARSTAESLLGTNPALAAAAILVAQADFIDGDTASARARLAPLMAADVTNVGATLLWARTSELEGQPVEAYIAYRGLAESHAVARRGALANYELAVAAVEARFASNLGDRRHQAAGEQVALLQEWEPKGSLRTLDAERRWANARGERTEELAALRALVAGGRNERSLAERRADLEMAVGDPEVGLQSFERLLEADPEDVALAAKLAGAQVRFRLRLLPDDVRTIALSSELTRADFATLLFWLVPGVRQGGGGNARIASDILEHRRQGEIVRVLNRGLMSADPRRHTFDPDGAVRRASVMASLLEILDRAGTDVCEVGERSARDSDAEACTAAARCEILDEVSSCRGGAALSGDEAVTLLGRALALLDRS